MSRQITQLYDRGLRPHGLKATQFAILHALRDFAPMTVAGLADHIGADRTSMSRAVAAIVAEGWAKMGPGPDARSKHIEITEKGLALFNDVDPNRGEAEAQLRALLKGKVSDSFLEELQTAGDIIEAALNGRLAKAS